MRIAILTTGRQDWSILRSTALALRAHAAFEVSVFAGGMHCEARFGSTVDTLVADGFEPAERMRWVGAHQDRPAHEQAGTALSLVGEAFARRRVDALLLAGDRFETASAALAATLAKVPIVHLHGGEQTLGAFDDALRHAITKLSHLHLVSHVSHAERVIAMGEAPSIVHVVGAPALDNLHRDDLATRDELEQFIGMPLVTPVVLVTLHPATLGGDPRAEVDALLAAMDRVRATYVITLPNVDPGATEIRDKLVAAAVGERRRVVEALGDRRYFGLLGIADAMLGNSSSGIIEAPVVRLPVVNIGDRQKGRLRGHNVIDVPADATEITQALERALDPAFRASLPARGPYGDGRSAARITDLLAAWTPGVIKAGISL